MAIVKITRATIHFFILCIGQAFMLVIYNENILQLFFMKALSFMNEIILSN